ncbi:MAG: motility associated factor glycosyltransferase family protein [Syntrophales bacterium]
MLNVVTTDPRIVLERNFAALQERYPELARRIRSAGPAVSPAIARSSERSPLLNMVLEQDGEKILYYDAEDPIGYCRNYIDALDLKYAPALVFMGFGLGYQIVTILNDLAKDVHVQDVVIVEKDLALFKAALTFLDLSQVIGHPNIAFFVGQTPGELCLSLQKHFREVPNVSSNFKSIKVVVMPAAQRAEGPYYQGAMDALRSSIQFLLQGIGNDPFDSLLGLEHILANVRPVLENPGIISFKGLFENRPAIIVAAGPSLNKNMHLLREASDRALLVCVDAALKPLLKAGIRPHIVMTTERTEGTVDFYANLAGLDEIFFIYFTVLHPSVYRVYPGPKIIASRYQQFSDWLSLDPGSLSGGPVVGNYAFLVAQTLGCNPLIMVGQDLSFKASGATHVSGMVFGTQEVYRDDMFPVEGNYGDTLMTNRTFAEAKASLEMQIEAFDGLCINATEGGARINGALFLDLKTSLKKYCPDTVDNLGLLQQHWQRRKPDPSNIPAEIRRLSAVLDQTVAELDSAVSDCVHGREIVDRFASDHCLIKEGNPDSDALALSRPVQSELFQLRKKIMDNPSVKQLWQIFQTVHTTFEMKRSYLFDQFHSPEFAKAGAFLLLREWFCLIGQLALTTADSINRAKRELNSPASNSPRQAAGQASENPKAVFP